MWAWPLGKGAEIASEFDEEGEIAVRSRGLNTRRREDAAL